MMMLTLPEGETQGDCKINGKLAEYILRRRERQLWFRYKPEKVWDKRAVELSVPEGPLVTYYCNSSEAEMRELLANS